jgi:hypothetical protein
MYSKGNNKIFHERWNRQFFPVIRLNENDSKPEFPHHINSKDYSEVFTGKTSIILWKSKEKKIYIVN